MILDFIRPSIVLKRQSIKKKQLKNKSLNSSKRVLTASQKARQLSVKPSTEIRILWMTIFVFVILMSIASRWAT